MTPSSSRPLAATALAAVVAVALVGCSAGSTGTAAGSGSSGGSGSSAAPATDANVAGDIPDSQAFVTYTPSGGGFTVDVPEGWSRAAVTGGVTFSDKYNRVEITSTSAGSAPTVDTVTRVDVPDLASSAPGFDQPKVTTVTRRGGTAVLLTFLADSAPNAVTGKVALEAFERYSFWRNGTTVTLTLSAPNGSDNVDPWRTVTDSFRWSA